MVGSTRLALFAEWARACLALLVGIAPLAAQDFPWHIGASAKAEEAPSAIDADGIAPGPETVVVAVIDSGVLPHPSLAGALLPGKDMVSAAVNLRQARSDNYAPDEREARCGNRLVSDTFRTHGTEVSSIIAGNGQGGMNGINPKAKIVPIRIFGACAMETQDLIDAIYWAAGFPVRGIADNPNPARVINVSISGGGFRCTSDLQKAVDSALSVNVFVVAAAGNNFQKSLLQPANCKGVISVGAVGANNRIEPYSALDPRTTLYAPGGGQRIDGAASWSVNKIRVATYALNLWGQENTAVVEKAVGTSFAAPVVTGYISLWLSHHPEMTPADWNNKLPLFLRPVNPEEKCADCIPHGLVANLREFGR